MLAFLVRDSGFDLVSNVRYFWIETNRQIEGDTPTDDILLLRSDFKFAHYKGKTHRVCQAEVYDFDDDPFVKVWQKDPFEGFEGYEQLAECGFTDDPEYFI